MRRSPDSAGCAGIGGDVGRIGQVHGQAGGEPGQLAVGVPEHPERMRLEPEPVGHQVGLLGALQVPGQGDQLLADVPGRIAFRVPGQFLAGLLVQGLPVPAGPGDRVVADQKQQVGHRPLQRPWVVASRVELVDQVGAQAPMDVGVARGIPATEVGLDQVAGHLVQPETGAGLLHETEILQPRPQGRHLVGVRGVEGRSQHRLGGDGRVGADLQSGPVPAGRRVVNEPVEQAGHQVRKLLQRVGHRGGPRRPADGVDQQGQGQWMAVGQAHHLLEQRGRQSLDRQQFPGLIGRQIAQRHRPQQIAPTRIGPPVRIGRSPARDHHQGLHRQGGQELLPQPVLHRRQPLHRVDEDHLSMPRSDAGHQTESSPGTRMGHGVHRAPERAGRRPGTPSVDVRHREARRPGRAIVGGEQRRLPDAARAMNPQHTEARRSRPGGTGHCGVRQPGHEQLQFRGSPDEPAGPLRLQPLTELRGYRCPRHLLSLSSVWAALDARAALAGGPAIPGADTKLCRSGYASQVQSRCNRTRPVGGDRAGRAGSTGLSVDRPTPSIGYQARHRRSRRSPSSIRSDGTAP